MHVKVLAIFSSSTHPVLTHYSMFLLIICLQETPVTCQLLGLSFTVSIPRPGYSCAKRVSSSTNFSMEALVGSSTGSE